MYVSHFYSKTQPVALSLFTFDYFKYILDNKIYFVKEQKY